MDQNISTVGPKYQRPAAAVPPAYKEVGDWKPAQPNDQYLSGNWWEIFQDPQLNALELQVNISNQNLKAAEAQYTQARAILRYQRADFFPTVTVDPTATRNKFSANRQPHSAQFNGISFTDLQARMLDAEEQLLNSTVKQYEQALELIENRFAGGLASDLEVEQARTQLETTRAQAIDVGVARAQFEHAVAVLMGKPPASFSLAPLPLTMPPPASANAQIGVAKAAYYPLVNLAAAGGFESGSITTLLSGPSILWSAGPSALFTIFDVGRRRAASDQAIAAYDQAVANYRQTVLTGFQQVEDNIAALRILEHEAQVQDKAVTAAQKYLELAVTRYKGGVTSYLEVTTAQSAALSNEVTAVNILGRRMVDAVTLVQALGGGWDRSALPERPECCGKLTSNSR